MSTKKCSATQKMFLIMFHDRLVCWDSLPFRLFGHNKQDAVNARNYHRINHLHSQSPGTWQTRKMVRFYRPSRPCGRPARRDHPASCARFAAGQHHAPTRAVLATPARPPTPCRTFTRPRQSRADRFRHQRAQGMASAFAATRRDQPYIPKFPKNPFRHSAKMRNIGLP